MSDPLDTGISPLRSFADFVRSEQVRLTEQWIKSVFSDADLVEADKLTYQQLSDHLPEILEDMCAAFDVEDLDIVEPSLQRNAKKARQSSLASGYRIEELIRELDLFHQVLADALDEFATRKSRFTRRHESRATVCAAAYRPAPISVNR